jgi:hypothetical protein
MDVNSLFNSDFSSGRVAVALMVALTQDSPDVECPEYLAAMHRALVDEPPPFDTDGYAEIYREASADRRWMAVSLMTNAEREGDGATRLWSLAACSDDLDEQKQLKSHAVDESRHALLYLTLLDLTFPGAVAPAFRVELETLSPRFSAKEELFAVEGSPYAKKPTIDDFIQMNIAEIRTTIHHIMQRPAIAEHCPPENLARITSIQDSLPRDELKHVAYTAVLIECKSRQLDSDRVSKLFRQRFHDFNRITSDELGDRIFDCSVACCAKRPSCRAKAPDVVTLKTGTG